MSEPRALLERWMRAFDDGFNYPMTGELVGDTLAYLAAPPAQSAELKEALRAYDEAVVQMHDMPRHGKLPNPTEALRLRAHLLSLYTAQPPRVTAEEVREWQKCPVCDGQRLVNKPPHVAGDQATWMDDGTGPYPCKRCEGTGTIERPFPVITATTIDAQGIADALNARLSAEREPGEAGTTHG